MRRVLIVLLAIFILFVASCLVLWRMKDVVIRNMMYPAAPPMPAAVSMPMTELLAKYEAFLRKKAPAVHAELQPGLTDDDIDKLEQQHNLKLTPDLRALYRWRNGSKRNPMLAAFPGHQFIPLDEALAHRDALRQQVNEEGAAQRAVYRAVAGHRDHWVGIVVDLAGDGYFFDPDRTEAQGSFFFCFADDSGYLFYPRFANYLAAIVEGQKAGIYRAGRRGVETADFDKAHQLMRKYGAAP